MKLFLDTAEIDGSRTVKPGRAWDAHTNPTLFARPLQTYD